MDSKSDDFEDIIDTRRMSVRAKKFDPTTNIDMKGSQVVPKSNEEKKKIDLMLKTISIFASLSQDQINEIIKYVSIRKITEGEVIMSEDDPADDFYIIKEGIFEAFRVKDGVKTVLLKYNNQGYFGELALIYDTPRCATIRALSTAILWVLDGQIFRNVVQKHAFNQRTQYENLLKSVSVFQTLSDYDKSRISDSLKTKSHKKEDIILEEGVMIGELYIVAEGEVRIIKTVSGKHSVRAALKSSDIFGFEGLLFQKPASYFALASTHCKLVIVSQDAFKAFLTPIIANLRKYGEDFLKKIA